MVHEFDNSGGDRGFDVAGKYASCEFRFNNNGSLKQVYPSED